AGRAARRAADPRVRRLLVPLDLLPRAERRAVRDRIARAGFPGRRGPGAPRREADPAAGVRAPSRRDRAAADAAAESARARVIVRERPASAEAEGALVLFHGRGADENDL